MNKNPMVKGDIKITEKTPQTLYITFDVPKDITDPHLQIEWINPKGIKEIADIPLDQPVPRK
ncbi:MAG: hypothetical protein C4589_09255 [Peptococcaceae bacterium]|nr:MAG: hypothetical protein C4589_09255 [Peptococcaceae bacterium]